MVKGGQPSYIHIRFIVVAHYMTQEVKLTPGYSGETDKNITRILFLLLPAPPFPCSLAPVDAGKGSQTSGETVLCCG